MVDSKWLARRSIWSGTLTFGLVSIPVSLFSAVRPRDTKMHLLDETGVPLSRRYYCPADGRKLSDDEMVRGYATGDSGFITVEDDELEGLQPEKSGDIDLREFVPLGSIPTLYFNKPYFLFPAGKSVKAYRLLVLVLQDEEKAGIATFVMRDREYLVAILARQGVLWAETLHFAEELRGQDQLDMPEMQKDGDQVRVMTETISAMTDDHLPEEYMRDRYDQRLNELVAEKRKRGKDLIETERLEEEAGEEQVDLMKMLKERLMEEEAA